MWLKIPKYFASDAQIGSTCSCQYKFPSSSIPKYYTDSTLLICVNSVCIQLKFLGIGLFLTGTIQRCFSCWWYNFVNNSFAWYRADSRLGLLVVIAVSSAYNLTELYPTDLWKSLIYNRKNKGPNTKPYYAIIFRDLQYRTSSWSQLIHLLHSFFHQVCVWYSVWFQLKASTVEYALRKPHW